MHGLLTSSLFCKEGVKMLSSPRSLTKKPFFHAVLINETEMGGIFQISNPTIWENIEHFLVFRLNVKIGTPSGTNSLLRGSAHLLPVSTAVEQIHIVFVHNHDLRRGENRKYTKVMRIIARYPLK